MVSESGTSRSPSPRRIPPPGRPRTRGREEEVAEAATQAEARRERTFHENEDARERIVDEAELRRGEEAAHRPNQICADLEDRLRALPPVPAVTVPRTETGSIHSVPIAETPVHTVPVTPVPVSPALPVMEPLVPPESVSIPEDAASIIQPMRTAAARHAEEITLEREQMASKRAELAAEKGKRNWKR